MTLRVLKKQRLEWEHCTACIIPPGKNRKRMMIWWYRCSMLLTFQTSATFKTIYQKMIAWRKKTLQSCWKRGQVIGTINHLISYSFKYSILNFAKLNAKNIKRIMPYHIKLARVSMKWMIIHRNSLFLLITWTQLIT